MRPDHYEIIVEGTRVHVVRVRSLAGMSVPIGGMTSVRIGGREIQFSCRFWGRRRAVCPVFFPHRPELPANPLEGRH
jgi:hypothetical protein